MRYIRHTIAKSEGSSYITLKVTAFFRKVPITIYVNPGQCPCKSVKTGNDINSTKIDIFEQNLDRKRFCHDWSIYIKIIENLKKFPNFPDF